MFCTMSRVSASIEIGPRGLSKAMPLMAANSVSPSALPFVMGGIRLGLGRGLMAVILGEMYFSIAGIGHLIMRYQAGLNIDRLMFLVVVTAFFGVGLIALARRIEAALGPWRQAREVE